MNPVLSIVLPIYNEEKNVNELLSRLHKTLNGLELNYEIIFCLDPCTDSTEKLLLEARKNNRHIKLITMARRFGQPAATIAGIQHSKGEFVVIMDSDLQDPPEIIPQLFQKISEGYEVVHARRIKRLGEKRLRLIITNIGYLCINKLSTTSIPRNVGDFKIMTRKFVNNLLALNEYNIFIKGLVSYVGYRQGFVDYIRDARFAGVAHYSQLWGSIPLALHGIICYSNRPLQLISLCGFFTSLVSFVLMIVFLLLKISGHTNVTGLTTILVLISFFSGLILFGMGVLGEYIGRIFDEVKGRPRYIVDKCYID